MNIFGRILSRTPKKDKYIGKWCTFLGVLSGTILSTGFVQNETIVFVLSVVSITLGGKALYHAQKTYR
jgi:hypothetical protein